MNNLKIGDFKFTNVNLLLKIGVVLSILHCSVIFYFINEENARIFSFSAFPLIFGLCYENYRLSKNWKKTLLVIMASFFLSSFSFIPKENTVYIFENHLNSWFYVFAIIFLLISVSIFEKELNPKLSEGIVLLQSVSFIYWIIDSNYFNLRSYELLILSPLFLIVIFSVLHSLTYIKINQISRFVLSLWSSIIMLVFGICYINRILDIEVMFHSPDFITTVYVLFEFFLFGIALMYIVHNIIMVVTYLPSKSRFYGEAHRKEIKEVTNMHIERFSTKQVKVSESIFALIYSIILFALNNYFQILPALLAIWIVVFSFPIFLFFTKHISK